MIHPPGCRPRLTVRTKKCAAWEKDISHFAAAVRPASPIDSALWVRLGFAMPKPKKSAHLSCCTRPDLDKLIRAVLDALQTAGLYTDDSRVAHIEARKVWAETMDPVGVHVQAGALNPLT